MYSSPYRWTPCSRGMNDEAPKTTKAPAFTFRQRGVLSEGFEIRTPVTVPGVKIWNSCQRIIGFDPVAGKVG
jgi:hypothetical protein